MATLVMEPMVLCDATWRTAGAATWDDAGEPLTPHPRQQNANLNNPHNL
jgi:hypothetical protein